VVSIADLPLRLSGLKGETDSDSDSESLLYIKATGASDSIHINKHIYKHSCVHIVLILNRIYILNDFLPYKYIQQFNKHMQYVLFQTLILS